MSKNSIYVIQTVTLVFIVIGFFRHSENTIIFLILLSLLILDALSFMDIKNTILNKHFEYIEKIMSIIPAIIALLSIIYVYHSNLNFVEVKLELENILNKLLSLNEFSYIIFMFLILTYFCLDIYIKIRKVIYANDN